MSWIVAQWYRVRKQQKVEDDLIDIQAGVRAIQSPLLPCDLFFTLKMMASDEELERVFGRQDGFRSYGPDRPMPPPPFGLPPGLKEGRLQRPDGYLDYREGILIAAGSYRLNHPGFNSIHCDAKHTVCSLQGEALSNSYVGRSKPLLSPPSVRIEMFNKSRKPGEKPFLVLSTSAIRIGKAANALAFDNAVFVDFPISSLSVSPAEVTNLSSSRLNGASICVTFDFFYIEGVSSLPKDSWPTLHNFQLWLGGSGRHLFTFSIDQLRGQITRENPKPLAGGQAKCVQIVFDCEIDDDTFAKGLLSAS